MRKLANCTAYLIVLLSSVLLIYYGNQYINSHQANGGISMNYEEELDTLIFAEVISLDGEVEDETGKRITFTATPFGGKKVEGGSIQAYQLLNESSKNTSAVSLGDKVVLLSYGQEYLFQYYYRLNQVMMLGLAIMALILLMGGRKGFHTIVALSLTCLSIFFLFIPSIKSGYNIYVCTVAICLYIVIETLIIIYGLSKKSLITALSCGIGIVCSGTISFFVDKWMKLTGYINDDAYTLSTLFGFEVNVKAVMFSMITIGALGAIMDVAMSVASPLCELKETSKEIAPGTLLKYGFNIGKDFMGTMTNTLILAYIGSSMFVVLVYSASNYPLMSLLNQEEIVFEFLQSLIGCLGILVTIPLTTIIASMMLSGGNKQSRHQTRGRTGRRVAVNRSSYHDGGQPQFK